MAIQRHCPPSSSSACFPSASLAAIIIGALLLTLLLSLSVYHALKARHAAPSDQEAQHELHTIQALSTAPLPNRPSPTTAKATPLPLPPHLPARNMPPPRPSSHTLSAPLFYNPTPCTSSTLPSTPLPPKPPRPPLNRTPRQLTHYLTALEARFTPETGARSETEIEAIFQGVRAKKLPRPVGREGGEVDVVRAWVLERGGGEGGGKGGWYV